MPRDLRALTNPPALFSPGLRSRYFATSACRFQQTTPAQRQLPDYVYRTVQLDQNRQIKDSKSRVRRPRPIKVARAVGDSTTPLPINGPQLSRSKKVELLVDDQLHEFSPALLRDLCSCPSCLDSSTKQKLFSTADIPLDISARAVAQTDGGASILWDHDIPGYDRDHKTDLSFDVIQSLVKTGFVEQPLSFGPQTLWNAVDFNAVADIDYEAYMQDDLVLHRALHQLHTYGLLFVSNVPESETSVTTIGERIGPIKNTFYGYTWDVRSVPEAKNVAYTSQDLGFHMDLLYMKQPPHIQLLHCIRSSAQGGASLFTDSHKAAQDLFDANVGAFNALSRLDTIFHYDHPATNLYRQQRPVFEMKDLAWDGRRFNSIPNMLAAWEESKLAEPSIEHGPFDITSIIDAVSWSPPFQGPFSTKQLRGSDLIPDHLRLKRLNRNITQWHAAAREFNALIHRPEGLYERMMRPGECVIFDNRRVLHARRAFAVGDAGTERWLRGAYLDKDPYMSKLQVLSRRFGATDKVAKVSEGNVAVNSERLIPASLA